MRIGSKTLPSHLRANDNHPSIILPPSSITGPIPDEEIGSVQRFHTIPNIKLFDLIDRISSQLSFVGPAQSTVSLSLVNSIEFVVCFLSLAKDSFIAAPLNPTYTKDEARFYLSDSNSKLLIVHKDSLDYKKFPPTGAILAARELGIPIIGVLYDLSCSDMRITQLELPRNKGETLSNLPRFEIKGPNEEDVLLLLHTSGTTGKPKAVPLTHLNLVTTIQNIKQTYCLSQKDRSFLVMPLFHVHGLMAGLLGPLGSGGSCVIPPKFSASSFWDEFLLTKSNWYTAVPTIHQILLKTQLPEEKLPKIRFIRSCSSALSPTTHFKLEQKFKAPVLEAYAMTEAAHQMTSNPLPPAQRKPGSVGKPVGLDLKIMDFAEEVEKAVGQEGEVCIRGPNVTRGYLNNEAANLTSFTKKSNFFRTGDRGKLDSDGYLVLTGRIKELINRGGEKISPIEIDSALLSIDGVEEAVSFSVPESKYGEVPWAVVILKKGTPRSSFSEGEVKKSLLKLLSAFKVPERILVVDKIPKTSTGKIQRRKVYESILEELDRHNKQNNHFEGKLKSRL
ncbi:hypothetical protein BY996DRAFT_8384927 [Phakopsora pachyrhizi]|uniref:Peroxisomal-coenzyme A synthetase n=1 Tax=Phakopsora pachyrhizi TaxID=170000 RepID=A0AAV0AYB5_PHAPC|nr:hypothetical protein BY996DRAFT_8384927 [Phakopsora pachyrhizi]CAH7673082.1 hypothetical protein PPACK8108_LOCUS7941 [Phakopsora pachyrhizi]